MEAWTRSAMMVGLNLLLMTGGLAFADSAEAQLARERTEREWAVKLEKLETTLQPLMEKHGVDMWIIYTRENDPDPLIQLFGDYINTASGHRNTYIFFNPGDGRPLERIALGTHIRGHVLPFFPDTPAYGHGYGEEGLAPHLRRYVHERDPQVIAINRSRTITMVDGLSLEGYTYLVEALGPAYEARFVSAEPLAIDYIAHRTPAELEISLEASWITWNLLRRAFSNEVITPGVTTNEDVMFWLIDQVQKQQLELNFAPSVTIRRQGVQGSFSVHHAEVIRPGDMLHTDFGIKLMGIGTDQQKQTYVLRPGETEPPAGLQALFTQSVRMAEIVAEELKPGVLGRDVKARAEARGREEGITNLVYSHAQGSWVHDAGAWAIHDWPERYGNHPREPVRPTEFWSVEFSVTGEIPEWGGQTFTMGREEDGWVGAEGTFHWMAGPQKELWTVRSH
ncbi:MAG: M24 family metallopeptidase [Gemmatimonadales bacterium]|nr:MAG: M24 family metallopeptidase [Gemmatimonadales bacterium]